VVDSLTHFPTILPQAIGADADALFDMKRPGRNVIAVMTSVVLFRIPEIYRPKTNGRYDKENSDGKSLLL